MSTAWLIERMDLDQIYYFTLYMGEFIWSADPNEAMRFDREQDAENMLEHEFFADYPDVHIEEHMFLCTQ